MKHINEYKEAIEFFFTHANIDFDTVFITNITSQFYEPIINFYMSDNTTYHVSTTDKLIVHVYYDTWRNPNHKEVIYDANEEVKKIIAEFNEWHNTKSEIKTEVH